MSWKLKFKSVSDLWCTYYTSYLREGAFFPTELELRTSLVFRLPVLLEELKSASLPEGRKKRKKSTMSQQDKTNCLTVIFSYAETLTDSCKCKNVGSTKLCLLLLAAPCRGQHSRSSASISAYPLHLPVTPTLSMSTGLLHLRHPLSNISTIPPLRMSKLSQPCLSFFVSKLHDLSCPSDILLSNLIHSGHPHWENLNMSSSVCSAIHT